MEGERKSEVPEEGLVPQETDEVTPRIDAFTLPDDDLQKAIDSFRTITGYATEESLEIDRKFGF